MGLASVAYNFLAVVFAALRHGHGAQTVDTEGALDYSAKEMATPYKGRRMAISEPEWDVFDAMLTAALAATLLD